MNTYKGINAEGIEIIKKSKKDATHAVVTSRGSVWSFHGRRDLAEKKLEELKREFLAKGGQIVNAQIIKVEKI